MLRSTFQSETIEHQWLYISERWEPLKVNIKSNIGVEFRTLVVSIPEALGSA